MIDKDFILEFYPMLLKGVSVSLQLALYCVILGIILGVVSGVILSGKSKLAKLFIKLYVTIIRGTPMLIQIAATYSLLNLAGLNISAFWSAVLSIGLNSGAYVSQIVVAGINSVGRGQIEAAKTLGFSELQITRFIVLPQAFRTVLPALGNELVTLVKDSSLASTIGVYELSKQSEMITSQTFDAPSAFLAVGIIYLAMTTVISLIVSYFEKRMQYYVER